MTRTNERPRMRLGLWTLSWVASFFICTGPAATLAEAQKAYVASEKANTVTVIDTANKALANVPPIPVGLAPVQIVFSQDATRAYVANSGESTVSVIDAGNDSALASIPVLNPPTSVAVSPNGATLYVMESTGDLEFLNTSDGSMAAPSVKVGTAGGNIAITPDGTKLYVVSSGNVSIVDAVGTGGVLTTFTLDSTETPDIFNSAVSVAVSSKGIPYIGFTSYDFGNPLGFTATGGLRVLDPSSPSTISLFALPGSLSIAADASLVFAGIDYFWANTLYGAAFFPGRIITTSDTASNQLVGFADLGADGPLWNQQHTAGGLAVTPDRSTVYVAIPSKDWVGVVDVVTNAVTFLSVPGSPNAVAVAPDPSASSSPLTIDAVDDVVASPLPALGVGPAVSNVLANDTLGGRPAAIGNVTLSTKSSTSPSITLDSSSGAVSIGPDAAVGNHVLTYEICESTHSSNCDQAAVKLTVRAPYTIAANSDSAKSFAGARPIASVLANDLFNGGVADLTTVSLLALPSGDPSIALAGDGSVSVTADAAVGDHTVAYRICEIASPTNCAESTATITVLAHVLFAASYSASVSRSGGIAVANVLANDTFDGAPATFARVTLSQVSSTSNGVALNAATGAVSVASGVAAGVQTLAYRICETASPSNCAVGTVTVNVTSFVISAVNDQARASNKVANTPIANVLANDTLGGGPATLANVTLSLVTAPPTGIQLDTTTGAVNVLGKVSGGTISFAYQICESGNPTNCSRATVTLNLSGK